jgi:hypothetical protein
MGGFNGAGVYVRYRDWTDDRDAGIKIRADYTDIEMDGIATGLSNAICRDGQSTVTANIRMNDKKFFEMAPGTVAGNSVVYEQVVLTDALSSGQTLTSTAIGTVLTLQSTETGASGGPDLVLYRNSSTPGLNDVGGSILFDFNDSGGTGHQTSFARIRPVMVDPTDTSEEAALLFGLTTNGTMVDEWTMITGALYPSTNGAASLGASTKGIADLFLANDAIITFGPTLSEVTITHSSGSDSLSFGGASGGYTFAGGAVTAPSLVLAGSITGATTIGASGAVTAASLVLSGAISGATTINASGAITGAALVLSGSITGATTVGASGAVTAASLVLSGSITGATTINASGAVTAGSLALSGAITGATTIATSGAVTVGTSLTVGNGLTVSAGGLQVNNTINCATLTIASVNPFTSYTYSSSILNAALGGGAVTPSSGDLIPLRDDADSAWKYNNVSSIVTAGLLALSLI